MMASSSGTFKEGVNKQAHNSVSSSYNGGSVHGEWGVPTFQHQQTISMDWTPEEQALLEEGLAKYATESNIIRYAKIAVQLKNKTVRDVALRCRWMTKKEISKRRKEDFNARKSKDRKEKFIDSTAKPSRLSIQSGLSQAPGMVSNCNDDSISYNGPPDMRPPLFIWLWRSSRCNNGGCAVVQVETCSESRKPVGLFSSNLHCGIGEMLQVIEVEFNK
ncbi:uncharacterized protein LOC130991192 isoform X3 [Salvia miltiorrhiza]|uniref:uncharacterized protein LOC130991192 isoform X3 n=1 Tax=Salvia miltiorrhiza TaxID=226208 RepID=UPI0025ABAB19|nr:uncharacterized protein LOC130991192 isoform X3 [Salvia miltiorrhiza]